MTEAPHRFIVLSARGMVLGIALSLDDARRTFSEHNKWSRGWPLAARIVECRAGALKPSGALDPLAIVQHYPAAAAYEYLEPTMDQPISIIDWSESAPAIGPAPRAGTAITMTRHTAGIEPAGSGTRSTSGYWGVAWMDGAATQGRRFALDAAGYLDARAFFNRLTLAPTNSSDPS